MSGRSLSWGRFLGALITILGVGLAALPAGILASGLASELEQRREELEHRFKELLLNENMDLTQNTLKIDALRREVGLNKEEASEIVAQVLREQEYENRVKELEKKCYCPHCGEKL